MSLEMGFEVQPIEAAVDQLDWAIRLLIDHQAYVPAITLAGAADGILDKRLRGFGGADTAHSTLKNALSASGYGSPNQIGKIMNAARNYLKHGTIVFIDPSDIDLKSEAVQQVTQAIINLLRLEKTLTSETLRFFEWLESRA